MSLAPATSRKAATSHVMPGSTLLTFMPLIVGIASVGTAILTLVEWGTPFLTVASLRKLSSMLKRICLFLE